MKDLLAGIVVAAVGIFMYAGSYNIKIMRLSSGSVSSAAMPRLCAVILVLLGIGIAATNVIMYAKEKKRAQTPADLPPEKTGGGMSRDGLLRLGGIVALLFLYCLFFSSLGFIISSALYLFATVLVLAPRPQRKLLPSVITAIITPIVIYYVFAKAFYMLLPSGVLG